MRRAFVRSPFAWGVAALLVHLLFLALLPTSRRGNESADFFDAYAPTARNLLDGDGLVDARGEPATRYPPGYPAYLAIALAAADAFPGDDATWIGGLDALSIFATGALVFPLARRLVGRRAAPWGAALWITYPPFLWLGKQPNSETPFLPLFLGATLAFLFALERGSGRWALGAGVLAGLAALVRPAALLLALPLALAACVRATRAEPFPEPGPTRRRFAILAVLVLFGQAQALLPWEAWMHRETGRWLPGSSGGKLSILDGLTFAVDPAADRSAVPESVAELMDEIMANRDAIDDPLDAAIFLGRRALDDPAPVVGLVAIKAARAWYGTESMRHERPLLVLQLGYLALALVGIWIHLRESEGPGGLVVVAFVVVYLWAMAFLVLSILRYLVPAMALLLPYAGRALAAGADRLRSGSAKESGA